MIWDLACLEPRIVEIICDMHAFGNKCPSKTRVPALLHVCREARQEGLRYYEILPSFGDLNSYRETYVNWELDSISLTHNDIASRYTRSTIIDIGKPIDVLRQKCRHLIMQEGHAWHIIKHWKIRQIPARLREIFTNLETFTPCLYGSISATDSELELTVYEKPWMTIPHRHTFQNIMRESYDMPQHPVLVRLGCLEGRADFRLKALIEIEDSK